jgi:hypothetical protein
MHFRHPHATIIRTPPYTPVANFSDAAHPVKLVN